MEFDRPPSRINFFAATSCAHAAWESVMGLAAAQRLEDDREDACTTAALALLSLHLEKKKEKKRIGARSAVAQGTC